MKTKNHAAPGSTAFKTALALFTGILLFAACEDTTKPSDLTPPAEVSGLSAVPGDGQAVLTWTDPADEDFDHVEIAFAPAAAGIEQPITVAKGTQSRAVTGLANGTTYTFTVKTVDATGNRSAGVNAPAIPDATTGDDTTPPAEVSGLNAAPGEGQIVLTWTGPADEDFDHVEIDFTPAATGLEQPITVVRGVQRRIITGLANETYYTFTVKTVDAAGNQSAGVNATAAPIAPVLTSSIAELAVYLLGVAGGSSADNPVPLKAALNLTSDWANLLGAIETADKYVSLDLTTCAMTNMSYVAGEFNPRGANTGERLITSLTLPAVATSIYFGTVSSPTFRYFTNLKNVKGSAVTTVGSFTFYNLTSLTTVSFPLAVSIGNYAFLGCSSLTTASFPLVTSIGNLAFRECSSLVTASFPTLTSIGSSAFLNTRARTLTIALPQTAPGLAAFAVAGGATYSKTVIVKTPAGRTGYDTAWEDKFKLTFGNGATITLSFEDL